MLSSLQPLQLHCLQARQALQETVRSFKVTNEELVAKGPGSQQDVAACDTACKVSQGRCLREATRSLPGPWAQCDWAVLLLPSCCCRR